MKKEIENYRFLDEAGDTAFYGKNRRNIIGQEGVSNVFIIGMVKFREPLDNVRNKINELKNEILQNPYFHVPSVMKKVNNKGYYFHATDDIPEIRKLFFDLIKSVDCSFEAVVGRKSIELFETLHKGRAELFYADLLSHLLKNKLNRQLRISVADRGASTRHKNLLSALNTAKQRYQHGRFYKSPEKLPGVKTSFKNFTADHIKSDIIFKVDFPTHEPLLCIADYFCWSIQRVFERGEIRFYEYLKPKISLVIDVYDREKYDGYKNYYRDTNPLTPDNKISSPKH